MGTKRAVLVGCLYRNTGHELRGCKTDVSYMKNLLIDRFNFQEENIQVLTDDTYTTPTRRNIMTALNEMIKQAEPGDVLFFFFSGYGASFNNQQAIIPLDAIGHMNATDQITSNDFRTLVNELPSGATLTIVADSGHSGGLIDGEPPQIKSPSSKLVPHNLLDTKMISKSFGPSSSRSRCTIPSPTMKAIGTESDGGILLSACQPDEIAFDVVPPADPAYGAFTRAIKEVLDAHGGPISNKKLVTDALEKLKLRRVDHHPGLYCSDRNADAIFLLQS